MEKCNQREPTKELKSSNGCGQTMPKRISDATKYPTPNATDRAAASDAAATGNGVAEIPSGPWHSYSLYDLYTIQLRFNHILVFLCASIVFNLDVLLAFENRSLFIVQIMCCVVNATLLTCLLVLLVFKVIPKSQSVWYCLAVLLPAAVLLLMDVKFYAHFTPRRQVVWFATQVFLVLVSVPLKLPIILLYIAVLIGSWLTLVLQAEESLSFEYFASFVVLVGSAFLLGLASYWHTQRIHRRAFSEAKQSLEAKMVIEEQSAEQERLLLSVLPEHVAVQMRQDLGSDDSEQFKKIYMSRHENVSILYADIVGFTAISSTYSAQDLVKMLNELFARFDRLAEKYHQLRIKILGDCYYCISGAPVERPDHAALCVHMGLSMVKAIKYVQQKTNSPVDMRVGIHTGAILAGILGQRQWQFDVYSRDVELANKMESSGMAGRVHISEKTLGFLNGEFEVEPAFGEKREESLRIAGLKTYFIKKVLIPFKRDSVATTNPDGYATGVPKSDTLESIEVDRTSDASKAASSTENGGPNAPTTIVDLNDCADHRDDKDFNRRLRRELLDRNRHNELFEELVWGHHFHNAELEKSYTKYCRPVQFLPFVALVVAAICNSTVMVIVQSSNPCRLILAITMPLIIVFILAVCLPEISYFLLKNRLSYKKIMHNDFNHGGFLIGRTILIVTIVFLLHYSWLYQLDDELRMFVDTMDNYTEYLIEQNNNATSYAGYILWDNCHRSNVLLYVFCIVLMSNISSPGRCVLLLYSVVLFLFGEVYLKNGNILNTQTVEGSTNAVIYVAFLLFLLPFHNELTNRVLFRWKTEVKEQKERASEMRHRNEKLVYNILPVHVAEHFMSNKHRSYDDLYSQSYDEVGVLFASMPNFSDFYSEDTVNNQGLECLRFLNEVISDFDALLAVPRFQDVIKIKTIGSTYMAASGLNPTRQVRPDDPIAVRWEHLALLVDFAIELKKALQCINEQSFNHFVLKMGINHGPITAGVIGARKPHYDIWGNTVNVASRMESTGKAGAIQVTEETCHILQTFQYTFEQRGLVAVKGKGQLMTYYLQGRTALPPATGPKSRSNSPMHKSLETLTEVDETSTSCVPESPKATAQRETSLKRTARDGDKRRFSPAKSAIATVARSDADAVSQRTPLLPSADAVVSRDSDEEEALISSK